MEGIRETRTETRGAFVPRPRSEQDERLNTHRGMHLASMHATHAVRSCTHGEIFLRGSLVGRPRVEIG